MIMMGLVLVVHTIGIAVHRLADMEHRPSSVRMVYLAAWLVATALVVGIGLRRVRRARYSGMKPGGPR